VSHFNVGLIGAGTVGGGVVKIIHHQEGFFTNGLGLSISLKRIVDKRKDRFAELPVGSAVCSQDPDDILKDDSIQIVIELVGGTTFAKDLVLAALAAGKHVVTANKALLAIHGPEIFETAEKNGVSVYFEAAVGGGMPAIKTIREAMIANDISSVKTIINGTCNYILTRMERDNHSFEDVLREAQKNGFAESDPTMDIEGGDTGHKVAIMASLLYGGYVPFEKLPIEGVSRITDQDIAYAKELGYRIKLLGIIKQTDGRGLDVRIHPAMLPLDHILASVANEFNAVLLEGDSVGQILLYGKGAGELPTASAVVSDVIDVVRNLESDTPLRISMGFYSRGNEIPLQALDEITTRYYLRFTVVERPKVLAPIAAILGDHGISIASVVQKERQSAETVSVVILTYPALDSNLQRAIAEIEDLDAVRKKTQVIRIEE
jgi:homoserine dehydrogenase